MEKHKIGLYPETELFEWIKENAEAETRSINNYVLMVLRFAKEHPEILNPNAV